MLFRAHKRSFLIVSVAPESSIVLLKVWPACMVCSIWSRCRCTPCMQTYNHIGLTFCTSGSMRKEDWIKELFTKQAPSLHACPGSILWHAQLPILMTLKACPHVNRTLPVFVSLSMMAMAGCSSVEGQHGTCGVQVSVLMPACGLGAAWATTQVGLAQSLLAFMCLR